MNEYEKLKQTYKGGGYYREKSFKEKISDKFSNLYDCGYALKYLILGILFDGFMAFLVWRMYGRVSPALNLPVATFWELWWILALLKLYFGGFRRKEN